MTTEPIPLFFAANENYFQHLCVALFSLAESNARHRFVVTVLVDPPSANTAASTSKIAGFIGRYDHIDLRFDAVEPEEIASFRLSRYCPHVSPQTYYRFLIPRRYPQWGRALYLDGDILVEGDLAPLWTTPLDGVPLAGVDVSRFKYMADGKRRLGLATNDVYVNAGVLLMDLEAMRQADSETVLRDYVERFSEIYRYNDQDAINHAFQGRIRPVSPRFNWTHEFSLEARKRKKHERETPVIHHFSSRCKPWTIDRICRHEARDRYFELLAGTPYRDFIMRYNKEHSLKCLLPSLTDASKDFVRNLLPNALVEWLRHRRDETGWR